ncbi:MAG: hypothetical protein KC457_26760, partial [Myxococcales bacterium]|nr:hypothetical protein [Myxococcales bacterium]
TDPSSPPLRAGTAAVVLKVAAPLRVAASSVDLDGPLSCSPWLRTIEVDEAPELTLSKAGEALVVSSADAPDAPMPAHFADDPAGRSEALATLEDRARLQVLARSLAPQTPSFSPEDSPLRWRWSLVASPEQPLPESGASLDADARVRIDLELVAGEPFHWFVSAVLVDPIGRLRLLNARMPEGIELGPGDREVIGVRFGRRGAQGLALRWPTPALGDAGPASLLLLASRRPIELGHIIRPWEEGEGDDLDLSLRELGGDTKRDRKPEHTRACLWTRFDFTLRRNPGPS